MRGGLLVHVTVKSQQRPFPPRATLFLSNARFSPNAKEFSRAKNRRAPLLDCRSYDRKCRATSRRLIFPRSFTGMASTIKIRFGTCHGLNRLRQNSRRSAALVPGDAT